MKYEKPEVKELNKMAHLACACGALVGVGR